MSRSPYRERVESRMANPPKDYKNYRFGGIIEGDCEGVKRRRLLNGPLEYSLNNMFLHEEVENNDWGDAQNERCQKETVV